MSQASTQQSTAPPQAQPQSAQTQPQAQQQAPAQTQQQAQEILQSLERDCQDKVRDLNVVRESLTKSQESVIAAQEAVFRSFQLLSINKERYLANIINQLQSQGQAYANELAKVKQRYAKLLSNLQKSVYPDAPSIVIQGTSQPQVTQSGLPTIREALSIEERSDNL